VLILLVTAVKGEERRKDLSRKSWSQKLKANGKRCDDKNGAIIVL
jgi:hypothetical protein